MTTPWVAKLSVRRLGDEVGYGFLMHTAEEIWREKAVASGTAGGELTIGPCAALMRPCLCRAPSKCDWCCGTGRVTERVLQAMKDERVRKRTRR